MSRMGAMVNGWNNPTKEQINRAIHSDPVMVRHPSAEERARRYLLAPESEYWQCRRKAEDSVGKIKIMSKL